MGVPTNIVKSTCPAGTSESCRKATCSYEDFAKLDMRVAKITNVERVEGATKLLKLKISLGTEERTLAAGIAQYYQPEALVGKNIIVIANLEPRIVRGIESAGMLLAATEGNDEKVILLTTDTEIAPGSKVR